jgi:hypothetical protein
VPSPFPCDTATFSPPSIRKLRISVNKDFQVPFDPCQEILAESVEPMVFIPINPV